jgi:uncharacterized protein
MQQEERDLIGGLFDRLRPFDTQPRDPEAERLIANFMVRQPSAAYLLTQTVLVQEQALKAAQARIAELEGRTQQGGGFLASAPNIGPWGAKPAAPAVAPMAAPQPMAPQPMVQGGGFLRSALTTAAGVAGGALLFEGIRHMFEGSTFGGIPSAFASNPLPLEASSPLMPPDQLPDQLSSVDSTQDDSSAGDYGADDADGSGFDDSDNV